MKVAVNITFQGAVGLFSGYLFIGSVSSVQCGDNGKGEVRNIYPLPIPSKGSNHIGLGLIRYFRAKCPVAGSDLLLGECEYICWVAPDSGILRTSQSSVPLRDRENFSLLKCN